MPFKMKNMIMIKKKEKKKDEPAKKNKKKCELINEISHVVNLYSFNFNYRVNQKVSVETGKMQTSIHPLRAEILLQK